MDITVSISEFRQNISEYIAKARQGHTIILKDNKKGEEVAELTGSWKWDPEGFRKALHKAAGSISAKNHPEWRTKKDVIRWVEKSRAAAERKF